MTASRSRRHARLPGAAPPPRDRGPP